MEKRGELHVVGDDLQFTRRAFEDLARLFKSAPTQVQFDICDVLSFTSIIPLAGKYVQLYIYPVAHIQGLSPNHECHDVMLELRLVPCSKDAIDNLNSVLTISNAMDLYAELTERSDGSDRSVESY